MIIFNEKPYIIRDNKLLEIPEIIRRKEKILNVHEEIGHGNCEKVFEIITRKFYWNGIKNAISNILKKCDICNKYNIKINKNYKFIETNEI